MPQLLLKRHFQTFARLRPASSGDLAPLERLEKHFPGGSARLDWSKLVAGRTALVVTAHEGESLVGAAVMLHRAHSATARLHWLGVCPSARGRGVGTLLLDAIVSAARESGAAVAVAEGPSGDDHLSRLLLSAGFECRGADADTARYKRLLWRRGEGGKVIRVSFA